MVGRQVVSRAVSMGLIGIGLSARILPLFNWNGRLLQQFPTEDGYLMMTVARNIALGRGMSTSQGLLPTNGTQPAFNFIEAWCFWMVGGDRQAGVLVIQLVQLALAMLAAALLFMMGRRILRARVWGESAAMLAAAIWFASSNVVPHTMNCLETGLYVVMV